MTNDLSININAKNNTGSAFSGVASGLKGIESAAGNTSKALASTGSAFGSFGEKAQSSFSRVADIVGGNLIAGGIEKLASGIGMLTNKAIELGASFVQASNEFNAGLANVASLGVPMQHIDEYKKAIQSMAVETGKSTSDLTTGLYQVVSAFGDTGDSAKILETNAKAAAAGVATTIDSINLTSAVTKGYGDTSAQAVSHVADLALKTVELGQTTFPELASSVGKVVPLSKQMGVNLNELFAVMATGSGVTGTTGEVATQYRGILQSLMAPTDTTTKLIKAMGYNSGEAMLKQLGLSKTIQVMVAASQRSGLPLQQFIGSIEGQTLALALAGPQAKKYQENLKGMEAAAGKTDDAFNAQTNGINKIGFKLQQASIWWETFKQKAGDAISGVAVSFLPSLEPAITGMAGKLEGMVASFQSWGQQLADVFNNAGGGLQGTLAALGTATGGTVSIDLKAQVETIQWGNFIGKLDWGNYVLQLSWGNFVTVLDWSKQAGYLRWGDFITVFDWGKGVTLLQWGDYVTRLDWTSKVFTLNWGEFLAKFSWADKVAAINWHDFVGVLDWSKGVVLIRWGDYVTRLEWSTVVTQFNGWSTYIQNLTWAQFIHDLADWSPYIGQLTWSSFVTSVEWGQYVTKFAWTEYIAPFAWNTIVSVVNWNEYITKLAWSEFVTRLTWDNVSTFQWSEFVPKLTWLNYVTPVGWLTYIAQLTWSNYIQPLGWSQFAEKITWANFITPVGWLSYIGTLAWDTYVPSVSWSAFLEKLGWSSFVESLSWSAFVESLSWSAIIPAFSWSSFITAIDLSSYIPTFPGWSALVGNLNPFGGSSAPEKHAGGTSYFMGGWSWVGERGPELMRLPRGSQIMSNGESMRYVKGGIANNADGTGGTMPSPFSAAENAALNKFAAATNENTKALTKHAKDIQKSFDQQTRALESALQKVPGLFAPSQVTAEDMAMGDKYKPKVDEILRRVESAANNDKDKGRFASEIAQAKEALNSVGIQASDDIKTMAAQFKQAWSDQSLFANKANLKLLNTDAIKASLAQQQQQAAGKANLMQFLGIKPDDATAAGAQVLDLFNQGVTKALSGAGSDKTGKGGKGGGGGGIGTAIVTNAVNSIKDSNVDVGGQLATALDAQLTNSDAFKATGATVLQKIVASWGDATKSVDLVGGIAAAFKVQIDDKNTVEQFKNLGGKIAQILKAGIDDYFSGQNVADSVSNGVKKNDTTTTTTTTTPAHKAIGTGSFAGGWSWVGESGPELLMLPAKSRIIPQGQLSASGGNIYVTINAQVNSDIDINSMAYRIANIISRKK